MESKYILRRYDVTWFRFLVEQSYNTSIPYLMKDRDESYYRNKLLICWRPKPKPEEDSIRLYACFNDYLEFARWQHKYFIKPPNAPTSEGIKEGIELNFYEVILGSLPHKPYFDIEGEITDPSVISLVDLCKDSVISNSIIVFSEKFGMDIDINKDILIYSSHGPHKRSYHIVINNWTLPSNKDTGEFAKLVSSKMPADQVKFIDNSVYSAKRQMRILGSTKNGENRPKIFHETFELKQVKYIHQYDEIPESDEHKTIMQMAESLITEVRECSQLSSIAPIEIFSKEFKSIDLNDELIHNALVLLGTNMKVEYGGLRFPFNYKGTKGGLILLQRRHTFICQICHREHEHEGAFLSLHERKDGHQVFFHCRRADKNQKIDLGMLYRVVMVLPTSPPKMEFEKDVMGKLEELRKLVASQQKEKERRDTYVSGEKENLELMTKVFRRNRLNRILTRIKDRDSIMI